MGLCNEERYLKAFYILKDLRLHLDTYWSRNNFEEYEFYKIEVVINRIYLSSRKLTGIIFKYFDASSAYWLIGESNDGFRAQHSSSSFFARPKENNSKIKEMEDTVERNQKLYGLLEVSRQLGFSKELQFVAKWWELYSYVPALLYPVFRYDDNLFGKEFVDEFYNMLSYIADLKPTVNDQDEKVLLIKQELLYKEVSQHNNKLTGKQEQALFNKYLTMSQKDIEEILRKFKIDQLKAISSKQTDDTEKIDPVYGLDK